ncbi:MAG: diacylglycerol O-acyltransferase / wax synthase [Nocardioidaceae bacterium]|nr:diacylglycerol O-acyltransferase / wax synthase [Nocardioidaceae bacterium]
MTEFMRNTDAFALGMEDDARLRSTVVTILTLDRSPDWDVLVDRLERVARLMPMFRQRVLPTSPPAPPRWVYDKDFDLRYHLRRVVAPDPGTFETVLEMARNAEMGEFDHSRPMWTATLVEGLTDGGAAIIVKMHHSLADGIGGMQIAALVFDFQAEPADLGPLPRVPSATTVLPFDGVRRSLEYDVGLTCKLVRVATVDGTRLLVDVVRSPRATLRSVWSTTTSVYRTVRPLNHTASPIMQDRRLIRELGVHEVPLSALKQAGRNAGGSLNDAFLAGVTGGLRRYHERHGAAVDELMVTMPISIRVPGDAEGGNRITLMRIALPVGESDPRERIGEIRERALSARNEPSLKLTQDIAGGLNLLPRWYIGSILRHVDFLASNVPGVPVPVWVGGAAVTMQYAFGPTIGAGVNITLITYQDTCALGINADSGAVPDLPVFRECLVEGFDEVLALGLEPGTSAPPGRPRKKRPARIPTPIA